MTKKRDNLKLRLMHWMILPSHKIPVESIKEELTKRYIAGSNLELDDALLTEAVWGLDGSFFQ